MTKNQAEWFGAFMFSFGFCFGILLGLVMAWAGVGT